MMNNYFIQQGEFTKLGKYSDEVSIFGSDVRLLTQIIQGNLMHDGFYKHYGLKHKSGLYHYVEDLLNQIKRLDDNPLTAPRCPDKQVQVCCRDYAVLLTSFLRNVGIPARARCGFVHFDKEDPNWYDHWICEYWNEDQTRWVKVDAQLNPHVRYVWGIKFDPYDVPSYIFQIAGKAWNAWRKKETDPSKYKIDDLSGSWLIRGNLLRDFAALNKYEIEPYMMRINLGLDWKSWGFSSIDEKSLSDSDFELLDKIALLTMDADKNLDEIQSLFKKNKDLQPPQDLFPRF